VKLDLLFATVGLTSAAEVVDTIVGMVATPPVVHRDRANVTLLRSGPMRATPTESATSATPVPPGRADAYPLAADLALIPLAMGSDRGFAHFVLTPDLSRHDGALYGGTGAAAAVMLMEAASHGCEHGSFTAWSRDGALIATGSQTASMTHVFESADDPQMDEWRRSIARAAAEGDTGD
jgi:hypothetical protein